MQGECNSNQMKRSFIMIGLSYAKIMPTRGKKACFQFPECSLSFAKLIILLMSSLFI